MTLFFALEASDESLLWLMLHLDGFGSFVVLPRHFHNELSLIRRQIGSLPIFCEVALSPLGYNTAAVYVG
jgi:hypothetical protein